MEPEPPVLQPLLSGDPEIKASGHQQEFSKATKDLRVLLGDDLDGLDDETLRLKEQLDVLIKKNMEESEKRSVKTKSKRSRSRKMRRKRLRKKKRKLSSSSPTPSLSPPPPPPGSPPPEYYLLHPHLARQMSLEERIRVMTQGESEGQGFTLSPEPGAFSEHSDLESEIARLELATRAVDLIPVLDSVNHSSASRDLDDDTDTLVIDEDDFMFD